MIKVLVFIIIFLIVLLTISVLLIKQQDKRIQKYKNDSSYYRNAVVEANNKINSLYSYIKEMGKIDDWKNKESQKSENDVIADIININNSRLQNNES